jgi:hypothetical protein
MRVVCALSRAGDWGARDLNSSSEQGGTVGDGMGLVAERVVCRR